MTKEQIEARIKGILKEREEIYDTLDEIAAEEDPWTGTPQSHIDYLNGMLEQLSDEYWSLCKALETATA